MLTGSCENQPSVYFSFFSLYIEKPQYMAFWVDTSLIRHRSCYRLCTDANHAISSVPGRPGIQYKCLSQAYAVLGKSKATSTLQVELVVGLIFVTVWCAPHRFSNGQLVISWMLSSESLIMYARNIAIRIMALPSEYSVVGGAGRAILAYNPETADALACYAPYPHVLPTPSYYIWDPKDDWYIFSSTRAPFSESRGSACCRINHSALCVLFHLQMDVWAKFPIAAPWSSRTQGL